MSIAEIQEQYELLKEYEQTLAEAKKLKQQADMTRVHAEVEIDRILRGIENAMKEEYGDTLQLEDGHNLVEFKYRKAPPRLVVDEEAVPEEFVKLVRVPMKTEIRNAIKDGAKFNWARLEAGEPIFGYSLKKR